MDNTSPTKRFLADYCRDDVWWPISIYAYDLADAEVRCKKLGLRLLGEHMATVHLDERHAGLYTAVATVLCWLRNRVWNWGAAK